MREVTLPGTGSGAGIDQVPQYLVCLVDHLGGSRLGGAVNGRISNSRADRFAGSKLGAFRMAASLGITGCLGHVIQGASNIEQAVSGGDIHAAPSFDPWGQLSVAGSLEAL
eukprot:Anaeramoba_flamelloidesa811939_22.p4 GENE.a811939_22~~a811939_22.p4  ORF type:complete len:111 (-),score=8.32 a811939_22:218-550(-)